MKDLYNIFLLNSFSKTIAENDLVSKQRFRLFKIVVAITFFVYLAFMSQILVVDPSNTPILYIMIGLFIAVFLNYFALAYHKKPGVTYTVLLLLWFSLIHIDTYYSGGIKNSANLYLADLILAAYMLLGIKGGIFATTLSILHLTYFYFVSIYTNWVSYSFMGNNSTLVYFYYFISTTASMLILTMQSGYIERSKNEVIETINSGKDDLAFKNSELQASEAALALKNKELERKNKELEQFAFVASHDLQEPIRTSSGFAELLQRQYKGKLDEKADKYLSFIIYSSERMNTLIKALLDYSRIGYEEKTVAIDCNKVIKELMADLTQSISESGASINVENLPSINGYHIGIKQLFQNLISNGIKFRTQHVAPQITISCKKEEQFWHFTVRDNGIGISKEYFDKIFLIFQRLHTRTEYEGSGIGLSHCKKIVELHNGKIWLESVPLKGSTFHFTIAIV
jgi:signal transduction histidine kinase